MQELELFKELFKKAQSKLPTAVSKLVLEAPRMHRVPRKKNRVVHVAVQKSSPRGAMGNTWNTCNTIIPPPPSRELWIDVGTAPCGDFTLPLVLHVSAEVSIAKVDSTVRRQPFVPNGSSLYLYSASAASGFHYSDLRSHAAVPASGPIRVRVVPPIGATAPTVFSCARAPRWRLTLVRKEPRR